MMGLYIGGWGWHYDDDDDDDGEGWHGEIMMFALRFMVDRHFMITVISLAIVSLLWLVSSANFTPMCTEASLMASDDCWISCMNLYSSVGRRRQTVHRVDAHIKSFRYLSWRWIFLAAVCFTVIFFASSVSLLFAATCLHCATINSGWGRSPMLNCGSSWCWRHHLSVLPSSS